MITVQLCPINEAGGAPDSSDEDECLGRSMAEYAELEYFCQASQTVMMAKAGAAGASLASKAIGQTKSTVGNEDFIGLTNPETKDDDDDGSVGEVEKLREENKRLKKTLSEKFKSEAD